MVDHTPQRIVASPAPADSAGREVIGDHQPPVPCSLIIHGHFYQPPREDPLTGMIPDEPGAAPYANWNERVHAECYRPNAELGNFEYISFNVGPTLFNWMQAYDPITYRRILAQDQTNVERFGVGNAIAQAYNHTILPLATRADKVVQVVWGIADFEHRFGRKPQGMWLPETAVNTETLEVLSEQGIEFTILAPWQAKTVDLDPTEPYWVRLPNGHRIVVFFYHGELSAGISFNTRLTSNAYTFVTDNLLGQFKREKVQNGYPQVLTLASDGELYGHHQTFRDWFLAYLVHGANARSGIQVTFPALWLLEHTPRYTVEIRENTSWSCHHGVSRWQAACDCTPNTGLWKAHLRRALNRLAVKLDELYLETLSPLGIDPWRLRERYIHVILGEITLEELISQYRLPDQHPSAEIADLSPEQGGSIALLLESQWERQRMFTSCGWFFEDFDRIEPRNNVAYAAQAVWLAQQAVGVDLAPAAMADLYRVVSKRSGLRGDLVFERYLHRAQKSGKMVSWRV
jgi:alpha-amylase/alpha-mannosidase (GH57 family)